MIYCSNTYCEADATHKVAVSENSYADSFRWYCDTCHDSYCVGCQHGEYRAKAGKSEESTDLDWTEQETEEMEGDK